MHYMLAEREGFEPSVRRAASHLVPAKVSSYRFVGNISSFRRASCWPVLNSADALGCKCALSAPTSLAHFKRCPCLQLPGCDGPCLRAAACYCRPQSNQTKASQRLCASTGEDQTW